MKEITVLGSTGSIGTQTLDVALHRDIRIKALTANSNVKLLTEQARKFTPEYICIYDKNLYSGLKQSLNDTGITVLCGIDGLCEIAAMKTDVVVNAVVGMVGLRPTLAAISAGNRIALANKETLVAGGELVMAAAKENGAEIIPVDSEHSAIFQCLCGNNKSELSKIILTASGGPFYGYNKEGLKNATKKDALKHPNWSMGDKITIDSATLMNKGLELIEAVRLFDIPPENIEIIVHRQSIIHSAVEYIDGSIIAQMGVPDMRIPIQYAVLYPARDISPTKKLSLTDIKQLTFEKPDEDTFQCIALAKKAVKDGGIMPCVLNSANEAAVDLFLKDKIGFLEIAEIIEKTLQNFTNKKEYNIQDVIETDKCVKQIINEWSSI